MRKSRFRLEPVRVRLPWLMPAAEPPPPRSPLVVPVAIVLADRLEQRPAYSLAKARGENTVGWTVQTLRLGPTCRQEISSGVTLTDDELREALRIARRMVAWEPDDDR